MVENMVPEPRTGLAVVPVPAHGTVSLPVPVEQAVAEWEAYQELTRRLLDTSDYQAAGGGPNPKRFKKKSAWRKYAKAFNLDDHVSFEHIERAPDGWPLWARIRVVATAPNGRTAEADHECHITERCCDAAIGRVCSKRSWDKHTCCPVGCDGRSHWGHPGDIPATALTRAKNRAIADLIGAGEVSAEEMSLTGDGELHEWPAPARPKRAPATRQDKGPGHAAGSPELASKADLDKYAAGLAKAHALGIDVAPFDVDNQVTREELVAKALKLSWAIKKAEADQPPFDPDDDPEPHGDDTQDAPLAREGPLCGCADYMELRTGLRKDGSPWSGFFCAHGKGVRGGPADCQPRFNND